MRGFVPQLSGILTSRTFLVFLNIMNIESTKFIVEVSDYSEVNDHLQLGWLLVNHYVQDFGEPGQTSQRVFYVLAWQNPENEPQHPEGSSYLKRLRDAESLKAMMSRVQRPTQS